MVEPLQTSRIQCPCCGELVDILVDISAGGQEYVEDCQVCCEPMVVTISMTEGGSGGIVVRRENA